MRRCGVVAWLCCLGLAAGCAQLLGIDDVSLATRPDAAPIFDGPPPPPPKTLMVSITGSGGGKITSSPPGIDCPGTCSFDFQKGTEVGLLQATGGGSSFKGWTGCTPTAGSCKITLDIDSTVSAEFADNSDGYNFLFVTSEMYPVTRFSPVTAADALCNDSAKAAGLPGNYVAWISSSTSNARERLGTTPRGWVRPDGLPVVDKVSDFFIGLVYYPARLTARSNELSMNNFVATATTNDGQTAAPEFTCADWTSTDAANKAMNGRVAMTSFGWSFDNTGIDCAQQFHLLCFGTDRTKQLVPPSNTGRIAFISSGQAPIPLTNLMQADDLCAKEARDVGYTGTFKAFMSMVGFAGGSRFDASGRPWVRPDGALLTKPGETLLDAPRLLAPMNVTADKQRVPNFTRALTGSISPSQPGFAGSTCENWTSNDMSKMYRPGHAQVDEWWGTFSTTCNETIGNRLFCLEQ